MATHVAKRIARWSIVFTAMDYIILIVLLVFSLVITAKLGPENYGIFLTSSVSYLLIVSIIANIILAPSTKLMSKYYGLRDFQAFSRLVGSIFSVLTLFSFLSVIIYFILTPFIAINIYNRPYIIAYMYLLIPTLFLVNYTNFFKRILLSLGSYRKFAAGRISDGVLYIVGILVFVFLFGWTVNAVVLGMDLYTILYDVVLFWMIYREFNRKGINFVIVFDRMHFRELMSLGKYFLASNTLNNLMEKIDVIIIPIFVPNLYVGYYSFAKNILTRTSLLFKRLSTLLYPTFSEQLEVHGLNFVRKLSARGITFSYFYTVPLAFFILAFSSQSINVLGVFIKSILSYAFAAPIIGIFSLILITEGVGAVIISYFNGIAKLIVVLKASTIRFISGLIFIPLLTIIYGIYGAAIGYVLALIITLLYFMYNIKIEVSKYISLRKIAARIIVGIILVVFISFLYQMFIGMGYLSPTISNLWDIVFLLLFFGVYILLDFTILSYTDILSDDDLSILQKIIGSNKFLNRVFRIIKGAHDRLDRNIKSKS